MQTSIQLSLNVSVNINSLCFYLLILKYIFSIMVKWYRITYLYFDRCTNDHGLLQEFVIKFWRVVVHVGDSDKDFSQAILPLRILGLDVEVVFRPDLCIQAGPGLRGDEARCWVDGKPADSEQFRQCMSHNHSCPFCVKHVPSNQVFLKYAPLFTAQVIFTSHPVNLYMTHSNSSL